MLRPLPYCVHPGCSVRARRYCPRHGQVRRLYYRKMMDAEQRARGELEERLTLLEEWVRLRFEELARDRS